MEEVPSRTLSGWAATAVASGKSVEVNLNEFLSKLHEPGIEPIAMHTAGRETEDVAVKRQGEEVRQTRPAVNLRQPLESERNVPGILSPDSPVLDPFREAGTGEDLAGMSLLLGIAAFRGDRLVGALDGNDARGYLWAVGRAGEGLIEIPNPVGESDTIALEVINAYSAITPVVRNGQVTMKLEITTDFELAEAQRPITAGDPTVVRRLIQASAGLVEREVHSTLQIVQKQLRSDIYGFVQAPYRRHPEIWHRVAGDWNEQVFPRLEVEVRVRSRIRSSGLVSREPRP